ncbi:MAG: aromatic amino acid transport family protein [Myxococcota bacterium]
MDRKRVVGAALLVAGTDIGAGMLVMPLVTGLVGFFPAMALFVVMWLLMLWCADLVVETTLAVSSGGQREINLVRMARLTLGRVGEWLTWGGFLLLFYTLVAAYMVGSGKLLSETIQGYRGWSLPTWGLPLPILLLCAPAVWIGFDTAARLNRWLMAGFATAFAAMLSVVLPLMQPTRLLHADGRYAWACLAIIVTGFAYHVVVPSLVHYLRGDVRSIRVSIMVGSLIPLVVYMLWELVVLAAVPVDGANGLADLLHRDLPLAAALREDEAARNAMTVFALLAVMTSFLGISTGLLDFLRDGLGIHNRMIALGWTFVPPLVLIWTSRSAFVTILEYGGIFVALLHGILPPAMVLALRSNKTLTDGCRPYHAWGGRGVMITAVVAFACFIALVLAKNVGWFVLDLSPYLPT